MACAPKKGGARDHDWQANFFCYGAGTTIVNLHLSCRVGAEAEARMNKLEQEVKDAIADVNQAAMEAAAAEMRPPAPTQERKDVIEFVNSGAEKAKDARATKAKDLKVADQQRMEEVKATAAAKAAADALAAAAAAQARVDTAAVDTYDAALAAVINPPKPGGMSIHSFIINNSSLIV